MAIDPRIALSAQQFALCGSRVLKSVEGLTDEELNRAPEGSNPMAWLWGHIVNTRCGLAILLGVDCERFHNELFGKGTEGGVAGKYPSAEEIRAGWDEVTALLEARFESITAEELSQPSPRNFPIEDQTIAGIVAYLAFHEAYHLGQLGAMRKWLGKGQLAG